MFPVASETGAAVALAGILIWSLLGGATAGVVTADEPRTVLGDSADDRVTQRVSAFQAAGNETNSSTTQHENPLGASADGDTDGLAAYLSNSLANRINNSTLQLSRGEYERADSLVDDQYQEVLGQYVDVAGSADGSVDPDNLRAAGQDQRRLVNETREFNDVYERYEEAKRSGDTERARRLARELDNLSENISRTTRSQRQNLQAIDNGSSADLNETIREIQRLSQNVEDRRREVVELEFVRTELDIEASGQRASFRDPVTIRGGITDVNGSELADRSVTIAVGERTYTVRTDSEGEFLLRYRPTTIRTDRREVTVRYVPANTSVYRSANASVPVTLEQTTATLSIRRATSTVQYGEAVEVRGRVFAGSVPVPNVPVAVTIEDTRISTVRTDEDGFFEIQSPLPVDITDGEHQLYGRIALSGRAIAARNETTGITVLQTGTNLSLTDRTVTADGIEVTGRLTTDDGSAVPRQQVDLLFDGATVATGMTDREGIVRLNSSFDADQIDRISTLTLRYDGAGTNLDSTAVQRNISSGGPPGGDSGFTVLGVSFGSPVDASRGTVALLIGVVVLAFIGSGLYLELRELVPSQDTGDDSDGQGEFETDTTESASRIPGAEGVDAAATLLDQAATDDAVRTAYFAVRNQIPGASVSGDSSHWQYHESLNGALGDGTNEEFYRLTELYEYAAFAERETTMAEAREAVKVGWSIIDSLEPDGAGTDGS